MIFVGDDWSEDHHDVYVMDDTGTRLKSGRLPEGLEGIRAFHELVAEHAEDPTEVVVGIETDRGMWVNALTAAGYQVYAINPLAVSRYRDRHTVAGAKSDQGDAKVLADLVPTDRHNHRPVAGDTSEVEAVKVLARTHQNLVWARTRHTNQLRNSLREYYPAALEAFDELDDRDTLAVLGRAPSPEVAARLIVAQSRVALKRGGRQRNLDQRAEEIREALRSEQLAAPDPLAAAFAAATKATVGILTELNLQIEDLEDTLAERFEQHPDAVIYLSVPRLGDVPGRPGARPVQGRPEPLCRRQVSQELCGNVADHRRFRQEQSHPRPSRAKPAGCMTQSTNGPSAHCSRAPDAATSTTRGETPETSTTSPPSTRQSTRRHPPRLPTRTLYDEHTAWAHRHVKADEAAA